ncbi:nuclear transport factor 2 family protein [Paracoccus suum]|uniref:Nuclear transport factor 2 family protein n=1 Tax=Paracoccus suum TaxID=2259340 RepID=A0A344PIN7_9RHOB|nr:nuclear transport factor 2 family protein [Paracoccus suum]AXC49242.1 nuclear transport factor 2 family protein [Paracoccus suum]
MSTLTADHLKATFDAFNRHDIDGVMQHFADDCVFYTVAGDNEFGNEVKGREAIAKAFTGVWTAMPDVQWADHSHFMSEDGSRGVSQWTFRATNPDGTRTEVQGADLFRIKDGKIVEKQALRKQRPAVAAK